MSKKRSKWKVHRTGTQWAVENTHRGSVHVFETANSARVFLDVMDNADNFIPAIATLCDGGEVLGQLEFGRVNWLALVCLLSDGRSLKIGDNYYDENNLDLLKGIYEDEVCKISG